MESNLATKKCIASALFLAGSWASCWPNLIQIFCAMVNLLHFEGLWVKVKVKIFTKSHIWMSYCSALVCWWHSLCLVIYVYVGLFNSGGVCVCSVCVCVCSTGSTITVTYVSHSTSLDLVSLTSSWVSRCTVYTCAELQ